jgi:hypothetical protein
MLLKYGASHIKNFKYSSDHIKKYSTLNIPMAH